MSVQRVYVVPNFSMYENKGRIEVPHYFDEFVRGIVNAGCKVAVVGNLESRPDSARIGAFVELSPSVLAMPATRFSRGHRSNALYSYIRLFLKYTLCKDGAYYLFFPSHLTAMLAFKAIMAGVKYGIYLRGEIPSGVGLGSIYRYLISRASFVVCTGAHLKSKVESIGVPAIDVSPMLKVFNVGPRVESRDAPQLLRLLFVGTLTRAKGIFELIDACLKCGDAFEHLSIVGPSHGDELSEIHQRAAGNSKIRFIGSVADARQLEKIYQTHDVLLLPSYREGFPRVVYEAMSYGLGVVVTPCAGLTKVLTDKRECLFVRSRSSNAIQDAVRLLDANRILLSHISQNGKKWVSDELLGKLHKKHHDQFLECMSSFLGMPAKATDDVAAKGGLCCLVRHDSK